MTDFTGFEQEAAKSERIGGVERLRADLAAKAEQCDKLAEVSRVPACYEYRAKAQAYRESAKMIATPVPASGGDEERLRSAAEAMLVAFAEGVVWNDEQRAAYEQLSAALGTSPSDGDR